MTDDEAKKIETRIREEYARDGTDHALSVIRLTQVIEHLRAREAILLNDTRFRLIEAALAGSRAIAAAKERAHEAIKVADATLEELGLDIDTTTREYPAEVARKYAGKYISIGHMISLDDAVSAIIHIYRTNGEFMGAAHHAANECRRGYVDND